MQSNYLDRPCGEFFRPHGGLIFRPPARGIFFDRTAGRSSSRPRGKRFPTAYMEGVL